MKRIEEDWYEVLDVPIEEVEIVLYRLNNGGREVLEDIRMADVI